MQLGDKRGVPSCNPGSRPFDEVIIVGARQSIRDPRFQRIYILYNTTQHNTITTKRNTTKQNTTQHNHNAAQFYSKNAHLHLNRWNRLKLTPNPPSFGGFDPKKLPEVQMRGHFLGLQMISRKVDDFRDFKTPGMAGQLTSEEDLRFLTDSCRKESPAIRRQLSQLIDR